MIGHYPTTSLSADYLRTFAGLILTAGPLLILPLTPLLTLILSLLAVVFSGFGLQTLRRRRMRLVISADGVAQVGTGVWIPWVELCLLNLAYYSTRSDGRQGWMQLTIGNGSHRIRVDSRLQGFEELVYHASAAARANNLPIDPVCATNLSAIGAGVDGSSALKTHG